MSLPLKSNPNPITCHLHSNHPYQAIFPLPLAFLNHPHQNSILTLLQAELLRFHPRISYKPNLRYDFEFLTRSLFHFRINPLPGADLLTPSQHTVEVKTLFYRSTLPLSKRLSHIRLQTSTLTTIGGLFIGFYDYYASPKALHLYILARSDLLPLTHSKTIHPDPTNPSHPFIIIYHRDLSSHFKLLTLTG